MSVRVFWRSADAHSVRQHEDCGGQDTSTPATKSMSLGTPALGGEQRQKTRAFSELQSYYLCADKFGRPAKGNDKTGVPGDRSSSLGW